ncbi:MAG: flagellar type III secretion system pore protein FliP [Planctomycetaceae bacterium]|nr:flagellar type III secretion system pore protein FliP [Planctomycetaceae bacterium]
MTDTALLMEKLAEGGAAESLAPHLQVALFMGALALLSTALVTLTAFTRIVIVLSFVRRALSTQEIPPTPVILGMALFLTLFVMGPTLEAIDEYAVRPYLDDKITGAQAVTAGTTALQTFMLQNTRKDDLLAFIELANVEAIETPEQTPLRILIPAFVTSELKTAFIMGFCIYVPFLLIDLVVSVVLMSLGMMMMPPVVVSTPFKLLLFVLVDGWQLVVQGLSESFHS